MSPTTPSLVTTAPHQQTITAVTEAKETTATLAVGTQGEVAKPVPTTMVVDADNNINNNSGNNGVLGSSGLLGTSCCVLTHPTIGVGPTTIPTLSKVEFMDLDLNKLRSMSTYVAQLTLKMPFTLSTLRS